MSLRDTPAARSASTDELNFRTELQRKSALLEATLENMDQGLMVIDAQERVVLCNGRAIELLGLPPQLMARCPAFEEVRQYQLSADEFANVGEQVLAFALREGYSAPPRVYERQRPNGTVLEVRTVPLPNGGAVRTYTDVTARRRAEAELRESEERFRALVTASAALIWRATPDGAILDVTGFKELPDELVDQLKGHGWLKAVHQEDRQRVIVDWQTALAAGQPTTTVYRARDLSGAYRWVALRGAPLKSSDGTIREWVGTLTDIHDRKAAEEELTRSEERYRLLAENANDIITRTDLSGSRVYVSPACRDILGFEPEELVGTRLADIVHPNDRAAVIAGLEALTSGALDVETITYRVPHRDGHWVSLEARRRLVRDQEGKPLEVVSILRDVTERRQLEEQLRQAQKMEAVGQLTGGVAHDFNNLLTVMIGNTELIRDMSPDQTVQNLATMSLEAAERGAALTQQLLTFGRRQSLKPEPLMLDEVVGGMMSLLGRTLGEHIEIRAEIGKRGSAALADRAFLESALLNLVVNSRDAMPRGGTLTITTGERLASPGEGTLPVGHPVVFVTVADTGTGIPADVLDRVFEPFFTTKEVGQGTGLGLSMVYGFAEQSGGHVSIKSTEGEGTAVTIVMRAIEKAIAEPPLRDEVSSITTQGREKVLVVEDEPKVLTFVSSQLESLGYEVIGVTSARDALALLERQSNFDLLFTDVVLPHGMSGVELARRVREMGLDTKVLLTSGYSEEVFEQHGRPKEHTLLLRKPYRRRVLGEAVRKALERAA